MKIKALVLISALVISVPALAVETVYSNNVGGDTFTQGPNVLTGANLTNYVNPADGGSWSYRNVRLGGSVGVNNNISDANGGLGSASFDSGMGGQSELWYMRGPISDPNGNPGPNYIGASINPAAVVLGTLGQITELKYDVYMQSGSTKNPSFKIELLVPTVAVPGPLDYQFTTAVFTLGGNSISQPAGSWQTVDAFSGLFGSTFAVNAPGGSIAGGQSQLLSFSQWQSQFSNALVFGIGMGVGSGEGPFVGAADFATIGFNGVSTTYDFEAVPEPATMSILGLAAIAAWRKKKSSN